MPRHRAPGPAYARRRIYVALTMGLALLAEVLAGGRLGLSAGPAAAHVSRAPASTGSGADSIAAGRVLAMIKQARAQAGLPAYAISAGLETSSRTHNQLMATGCGLSQQCPGEPLLRSRETASWVHSTLAGQNIGVGGPVADTTAEITHVAVALTHDMLNEKPPGDSYRLNLLSSTFRHIGIAIYCASSGTIWMTQDFSN